MNARSILCLLTMTEMPDEERKELEDQFAKLTEVSTAEQDRWLKYKKSEKALQARQPA